MTTNDKRRNNVIQNIAQKTIDRAPYFVYSLHLDPDQLTYEIYDKNVEQDLQIANHPFMSSNNFFPPQLIK